LLDGDRGLDQRLSRSVDTKRADTRGVFCISRTRFAQEAVKTAFINKWGGSGLISGRKAFQRPMKEGVGILNAIQDVYLSKEVTIA
jgi:hypothetical protein